MRNIALFAELTRKIKADDLLREKHVAKYGYARRPIGIEMNGKVWVALDGAIYQQTQEGPYNFVNAIHDHALHFFGEDMLATEEKKEVASRHPAIRWMHAHVEAYGRNPEYPSGNGAAWYRFAYDLYTIRDNAKLQDDLRARLLSSSNFQAARYELKVAAICASAGFDLQFEDERDNRRRHPEFVGTDRLTQAKIAVEVKSRHRKGVLGFSGGLDVAPGYSVDVRKNILDAYKKQPEVPFYIFIDVNLPSADNEAMQRWQGELQKTMRDLDAEGYASPCPANSIFFTNDPSHYVGSKRIGGEEDMLWVRVYTASEPSVPHPSNEMTQRLVTAHAQRVVPPTDFHENP
ncbi:hypothetical protein [Lysobacter sp. A378]